MEDAATGKTSSVTGAQAIAQWVDLRHRAEFESGRRRRHLTMTFVLKPCDGVHAVSGAYFCVMVDIEGVLQKPAVMGHYDDRLQNVDGEWRFMHRLIHIEGKAPRDAS